MDGAALSSVTVRELGQLAHMCPVTAGRRDARNTTCLSCLIPVAIGL